MTIGALILARSQPFPLQSDEGPTSAAFLWAILGLAVVTVAILMLAEGLSQAWLPLFGFGSDIALPASSAIYFSFLLDILAITYLVIISGGSHSSPFSPLFFIIPTLALFLRLPTGGVIRCLVVVAVAFTFGFLGRIGETERRRVRGTTLAFWIVSLASFVLASIIGYVTRPQ